MCLLIIITDSMETVRNSMLSIPFANTFGLLLYRKGRKGRFTKFHVYLSLKESGRIL
jgi:hypothetical protein